MSGITILVSDHNGIHIPRMFAERFDWSGADIDDLNLVSKGPDHEWYWEAWESILRDAFHVDREGHHWKLHQDGDLFAICDELMTNEEYKDFFGEDRC